MLHDTPLRKRRERYVRARSHRGADEQTLAARPGAAQGRRIAPPDIEFLPYGPRDEHGLIACEIVAALVNAGGAQDNATITGLRFWRSSVGGSP